MFDMATPVTLSEWLQYLETLPSGLSNSVAGIDSLAKNKRLGQLLGVLQFPGKVITIAGTNGKGSCVAFLESILLCAGYQVGAYISPHLLRYNERIRINGRDIDDARLLDAFATVANARDKEHINLNYFEFSTFAALLIFKQLNLDVLLLEVGLGGRIDPVNIVASDIAVITTIALDHIEQLGDTREKIGYEKAGIMRAQRPIVCGDVQPPASISAAALESGAILYCSQRDFVWRVDDNSWEWCGGDTTLSGLSIPILPIQDAATAVQVFALLQRELPLDVAAIRLGLSRAFLPGRFQFLHTDAVAECIVDVAHNPESAIFLAEKLLVRQQQLACERTVAVVSMLRDKDVIATLQPLVKIIDVWYVAPLSGVRAATLERLLDTLHRLGAKRVFSFATIAIAMQVALAECGKNDRIVGFGSFYVVAQILDFFGYGKL